MSDHIVEILECICIDYCKQIWRIKLDQVEMEVTWSSTKINNDIRLTADVLKFSNPLVKKHKDYKNIRNDVLHALLEFMVKLSNEI